jgi:hypothetical protein
MFALELTSVPKTPSAEGEDGSTLSYRKGVVTGIYDSRVFGRRSGGPADEASVVDRGD